MLKYPQLSRLFSQRQQNIRICGYDGIGRRAGFRFLCREACGFDPHYPYHVAADVISFAATFLQKSPLTHFVAAPLQIEPACAGLQFGFGCGPVGRCIFFGSRTHVGASFISLAPAFLQKSERAHAAAPPLQIEPATLGFDLVLGTNLETAASILLRCSIKEVRFSNCFWKTGSFFMQTH